MYRQLSRIFRQPWGQVRPGAPWPKLTPLVGIELARFGIENGDLVSKTHHKVFRPHYNRKTAFSNVSTLESVFEKLHFRRPHYNRKTAFSYVSTLESVFEKFRFPPFSVTEDAGLVWTKGLTV